MEMKVELDGPFFNHTTERAVHAAMDTIETQVGNRGVNIVQNELDQVLQNPSGFYRSRIQTSNVSGSTAVTDGGIVYGPWLAGTSSRNASTRFKGYHHWRQAAARLEIEGIEIAEGIIGAALEGRGHGISLVK